LVEIKKAFPNVKMVALPEAVDEIKNSWEAKVKYWKPNMAKIFRRIPSSLMCCREIHWTLEGNRIMVFGKVQGDAMNNSYVWISGH
jgi:hypothetical protein